MLLGRMMPMALLRILFYLDRPDLLLIVAVLSKHMNNMAKHDVLWRLSTTDQEDTHDVSGVAILAKGCNLLEKGAEHGIASPTDEQVAAHNPNTQLWYPFHMDVIRAGIRHREGPEALPAAALVGDVPKLRLLLWAMVDIEARSTTRGNYEKTALMCAAQTGHAKCTRMLIEAGSDVKARDGRQKTALMYAATNGCAECTRMLLEAGSDVTAKSKLGKTAMYCAMQVGRHVGSAPHMAVVALLKKALHQVYDEACASATESTPAVEEAFFFLLCYGR